LRGEPTGFWGKLERGEDGRVVAWHPLEAHCADVAAVAECLLRHTLLGRRIATLLNTEALPDLWIARICTLVAIHDAGKVNHGFQDRALRGGKRRTGHVAPFVAALQAGPHSSDILDALELRLIADWFADCAEGYHCLLATFEHHGRPFPPSTRFQADLWRADARRDPLAGLRHLQEATRRWFPAAYGTGQPPFPASTQFQHALNGLVTLADWIGSDARLFPYAEDATDRMPFARLQAAQALRRVGLDVHAARERLGPERPGFGAVCECPPRPVQRACAHLPDHPAGSLVVLESETGSGKTEAALTRFLQLLHAGLVDGMYFALPTRASAVQIHGRVVRAVRRALGTDRSPPVVLAVPGYLRVDEAEGQPLPKFDVLWDDRDKDRWRYRGWAAENPKRYLAAAIAVGTIDQVLVSTLRVKHAHLRATALARQFLVVDEVHASDAYMTTLLERVLRFHIRAGGHALLMSATLGSVARTRLTRSSSALPLQGAADTPFPLITQVDFGTGSTETVRPEPAGPDKEVGVQACPIAGTPGEVAGQALRAAAQGARVLVIRNTVKDCVATQLELEASAGPHSMVLLRVAGVAAPHHSRYSPGDRKLLDQAVERCLGKGSGTEGVVIVATQTVEQSLDIDADLMLSDLCPADVLLQRIGRLHRHAGRVRPDRYARPRLVVLVPEDRHLDALILRDGQARGPYGLGTVYEDLCVVEATWRQIEQNATWGIPRMNRALVEAATHPEALDAIAEELGGPWKEHRLHMRGLMSARRAHASIALLPRGQPFAEQGFPDDPGRRVKTRLGEGDRRALFAGPIPGPFGRSFKELTIPFHYAAEAGEDALPENVLAEDGSVRFDFGGRSFVYDRLGLRPAEPHQSKGGVGDE